jgi:hypothetical protein
MQPEVTESENGRCIPWRPKNVNKPKVFVNKPKVFVNKPKVFVNKPKVIVNKPKDFVLLAVSIASLFAGHFMQIVRGSVCTSRN